MVSTLDNLKIEACIHCMDCNRMDWTSVRYEQNHAYEESLLQDRMKKVIDLTEDEKQDHTLTDHQTFTDEPDKKLTLTELREKRIQAFTQTSAKKTCNSSNDQ